MKNWIKAHKFYAILALVFIVAIVAIVVMYIAYPTPIGGGGHYHMPGKY